MTELVQIAEMDWYPFTCLPREMQRVVSLERSAGPGSRQPVHDAMARRSDGADRAHYQHVATRVVAAQLLEAQGAGDTTVPVGHDRAPQWPQGFVGSITHTARFAAVSVMPQSVARSVGIDVECELAADQQALVRQYCLVDDELDTLLRGASSLSEMQILTLCFSAKEAVFKCLHPLLKHYFDFTCVRVVAIDESTNLLSIKVLDAAMARYVAASDLTGSYRFIEGHVFTAFRLVPC